MCVHATEKYVVNVDIKCYLCEPIGSQ